MDCGRLIFYLLSKLYTNPSINKGEAIVKLRPCLLLCPVGRSVILYSLYYSSFIWLWYTKKKDLFPIRLLVPEISAFKQTFFFRFIISMKTLSFLAMITTLTTHFTYIQRRRFLQNKV